jgi:hypothetical protein
MARPALEKCEKYADYAKFSTKYKCTTVVMPLVAEPVAARAEGRRQPVSETELREAGYRPVWGGERTWNGVAILARDTSPVITRRQLPGENADKQSRYIEAAVNGVLIACIYLPNGNPQPGPKFDYKLAWFERLIAHAATLLATDALATSTWCPPTSTSTQRNHGQRMHWFSQRHEHAFDDCSIKGGSMRSGPYIPSSRCIRSGIIKGSVGSAMLDCDSTICC